MPIAVSGFEHLAGEMLSLYEEAEDQMLRKMAKNLSEGTRVSNWTRKKYGQARDVKKQLHSVLSDLKTGRRNLAEGFVKTAYGQSSQAFVAEAKRFTDVMGITALSPNSPKVAAILSELDKSLAAEDRFILRRCNDAYADIVGRAAAKVATGSITYRQAVKEELKTFADRGIAGFVDKAGRHWDMATYAEMATLTAIERATIEGYCDTMAEYGYDLAIISSHVGACPLCVAWEDVIVSVSGESNEYPSLEEAENAGCFHPRCLHHLSTYYEGITHKGRNAPRPVREPSHAYSARQTQRGYEREVRRWKRRMAVANDPQAEREAYAHVRHYQQKIRNLIGSYDEPNDKLMRKYWREGGTQALSAAAKKLKPVILNQQNNGLKSSAESGKIKGDTGKVKRTVVKNSELPNGLPAESTPNSIMDKTDDAGNVLQRRYYGPDGRMKTDFDTSDHGMPQRHPTGAHKHEFDFSRKNPHGKPLPLTDDDLRENADIIQKGVNYHDKK